MFSGQTHEAIQPSDVHGGGVSLIARIRRHSWALRATLIARPERCDRLLLVLVLAYPLLVISESLLVALEQ